MNLPLRQAITLVIVIFIFGTPFFFASCKEEKKPSVNFVYNPDSIPSMRTQYDTMLISDSGVIRYKVIAKTWEVYEQAKESYSYFPDGIYLEQFDTLFNVITVIRADTAWNFDKKNLWHLKGKVFVRNAKNVTFNSEELFWDRNKDQYKIYSHKLVTIDQPGNMLLVAADFESDEQFDQYVFSEVHDTKVYVNEDRENGEENDQQKEE